MNFTGLRMVHAEKDYIMRHLTLSGYYAGKPICGIPKNTEDIYQHYSLTYTIEHLDDLCPKCKQIYVDMENEPEDGKD